VSLYTPGMAALGHMHGRHGAGQRRITWNEPFWRHGTLSEHCYCSSYVAAMHAIRRSMLRHRPQLLHHAAHPLDGVALHVMFACFCMFQCILQRRVVSTDSMTKASASSCSF